MGNQLTLKQRYEILKRKFTDKVKSSLISDTPPGARLDKGEDMPTVKEMRSLGERHTLSSFLPYESFDEDTGLYFNRDTVGFMLYCMPATGISVSELSILNGIFNQPHKSDTSIQITMYADPNIELLYEQWKQNKLFCKDEKLLETFRVLADNRIKYLNKGKWKSLFTDQSVLPKNFHLIFSYTVPVPVGIAPVDLSEDDIDYLVRMKGSIKGALSSAGISSDELRPDLFINIMNGFLNPSDKKQPILKYDEENYISEQMVSSDTAALFDSGVSTILHEDKPHSILPFHVRQFPKEWVGSRNRDLIGSFTNNILRLPCPALITLTITVPDQVSQKGVAKRKAARATQMASSNLSKYVPTWHERKKDWDFVQEKMGQGNKSMQAFYQIILMSPQGKEQECEQSLKGIYDSLGWAINRSRYIPQLSLLGALPMGMEIDTVNSLRKLGHYSPFLSWTCTNIAPWIAEWKGSSSALMMFIGRLGQLTFFDPFTNDKGNFNIACCAAPGGGKSFFTNEWIFSCLGMGGRAFVIDAGHSYRDTCKLLNGTYIDFGEGQPIMNPFTKFFSSEILKTIESNPKLSVKEYIEDHMPLLKMIIGQMASPERDLSSKQKAILEQAIMNAVTSNREKTTITHVSDECLLIKDEKEEIVDTARDISMMLHSYTKNGMYGRYFEGENNIDLDNPMVVLELDALNAKGDLQSVVLLILMLQINQVMYLSGNKKQKKLCIIDEAWRLLGKGRAGEFIEEGYRVARKHGGSFMTITQKISDYYSSETAKAAYMSSDFTLFLRQKADELMSAVSNNHIDNSDGKVDVLRGLETKQGFYSEIAISSPDGLSVVRFIVDPVTEKLYSTKAEEVEFLQEQQNKGVDLMEAINELISKGKKR